MTALRQREPRQKDDPYLRLIRRLPCISCGIDPCGEAAHVRMSAPGKPNPGMGQKPHDEYALPLCHDCHMEQHRWGERHFWSILGINPVVTAKQLYNHRGNFGMMRSLIETLHFTSRKELGEVPF